MLTRPIQTLHSINAFAQDTFVLRGYAHHNGQRLSTGGYGRKRMKKVVVLER